MSCPLYSFPQNLRARIAFRSEYVPYSETSVGLRLVESFGRKARYVAGSGLAFDVYLGGLCILGADAKREYPNAVVVLE